MTAIQVQFVAQLLGDAEWIGAGSVAFVDEGDAGNLVAGHLPVDGNGLRLNTAHRAEDQHRPVKNTQGAFNLDGEIDVAGGVDDVDVASFPGAIGGSGLDGDTAFFFQFHGVHGRADTVFAAHLVDGVNSLGVKQNSLRQRGFSRINMGADTDIPYVS